MTQIKTKHTPAMQQYYNLKSQYEDCILFFRMGDFYEMFDQDAETAHKELGITITTRNKNSENPVPLAGIPYHAADKYLAELTRKGYKVAICEQTSDPSLPGIVQRDVVRVVTPGTTLQEEVLDQRSNNYIVGISEKNNIFAMSHVDLTTGEFRVCTFSELTEIQSEIFRLQPTEVLLPKQLFSSDEIKTILQETERKNYYYYELHNDPHQLICQHFELQSLEAFGIESSPIEQEACALVLSYLIDTQKTSLTHLKHIRIYSTHEIMSLDESTIRNLELLFTQREGKKQGSLLGLLDRTATSMGGRMLRKWLLQPLLQKKDIEQRLDAVEELYHNKDFQSEIKKHLGAIYDIERILAKISMGRANGRDLVALKQSLIQVKELSHLLKSVESDSLSTIQNHLTLQHNG